MFDTNRIFDISSEEQFQAMAFNVFQYQYEHNAVYRSYCDLLNVNPSELKDITDIPFLPIQFFKSHNVISGHPQVEKTFESSGTTTSISSKHLIADLDLYRQSYSRCFELFYGQVTDYAILALLPSYLERQNSSLVYMVNDLIKKSKHDESAFFLNDHQQLYNTLKKLESDKQKTLLLGVSFALLDFLSNHQITLEHTLVMETGGMKGRREELIREALHHRLKEGFGVTKIHSEYGMTELLSQAYSKGHGRFNTPPWMKILIRNPEDPFSYLPEGKAGGLNIIDLANINSCAFIESQDLGKVHKDRSFEVLGRFDHAEIRGCNLMAL